MRSKLYLGGIAEVLALKLIFYLTFHQQLQPAMETRAKRLRALVIRSKVG